MLSVHYIRKLPPLSQMPWLANLLSILAGILYAVQSYYYARVLPTILDEGAYLIKGYWFATGQYTPYEPYGVWTNHMPLSFLIPGYVQAWFGPGLRTGRYFAIVLGLLMIIGLWLVARRLSGKWWAFVAVLSISLNVAIIKAYSIAVSQVLVASILIWILVFALGKNRSLSQLMIGSTLAGILVMTRINMSPILPLLLSYIIWQHGWQIGLKAAIPGLLVVAIGHALYWPGIFEFWRRFLPSFIDELAVNFQFNERTRRVLAWNPVLTSVDRFNSLLLAIRLNFVPLICILSTWILWKKKNKWEDQSKYRSAIFISISFATLMIIHSFFTLGNNSCVYCLGGYITFFSSLGIILLICSIPFLQHEIPRWRQYIIAFITLIILIIVGYSSFDVYHWEFISPKSMHTIIRTKVPRISSLQILAGEVNLWVLLQNKFGMDFQAVYNLFQKIFSSVIIGVTAWLSTLLLALIGMTIFAREKKWAEKSYGVYLLMSLLVIGMMLSPTPIFADTQSSSNCEQDVLSSHEIVGEILSTLIPQGALVYWDGGSSAVPLLYLPHIQIYPAQINGVYSRMIGGDVNLLLQEAMWNEELSELWLSEANYLIVNESKYEKIQKFIDSGIWEAVAITSPTVACDENTALHILKKIQ